MKYSEAIGYIHSLSKFGSIPGLERISQLLELFDNPQDDLKIIHIAGTNGKGSVCAMTAKALECEGYKVGLYTSPFVLSFRERIQINGQFISKRSLAMLTQKLINTGIAVTEFEFITAMAFLYFKSQKCDVVVLETGLGGRLDATNVVKAPIATAITSISLDHTGVLGDTLGKIAFEKCGIIKNGSIVVSGKNQPNEALAVIKNTAPDVIIPADYSVVKSDFCSQEFIYNNDVYKLSLIGEHQIENAVTAIEVLKNCRLFVSDSAIKKGLQQTFHPARLEVIKKSPLLVLDGAHNPSGAEALAAKIRGNDFCAIIGVMADKDYERVLKITAGLFSKIVTVTVKENPRSLSADALAEAAAKYNNNVYAAKSYEQAIELTVKNNKPTVVFGSLYLASAIRPLLININ